MKKFYTLLAVAAMGVSAFAATPTLVRSHRAAATHQVMADVELAAPSQNAPMKETELIEPPVNGTWQSIGTGTVVEDFLLDIDESASTDGLAYIGKTWEIDIEECVSDPGWYRAILYNENSPIYEMAEEADTEYTYFNTSDPNKVYMPYFSIMFGEYEIFQLIPGGGLKGGSIESNPKYGKLENGIITFPPMSFAYRGESGFPYIDRMGYFSIGMPGVDAAPFRDLGKAVFHDNLIANVIEGGEKYISDLEIKVQVDKKNNRVFNIVQPWVEVYGSFANLIVNCSNDFVIGAETVNVGVIDNQCTGFAFATEGYTSLMSRNLNTLLSLEEFVHSADFKLENNLYFNSETRELMIPPTSIYYLFTNDTEHVYSGNAAGSASYMTVPEDSGAGINNVAVENSDAPVEYFNLQGIRVANPENGVYIRRQGTKATKVLVR